MTDGTTATQVSPVQEEDMAKVREVFQKALDAIIAATELSKTVHAMRSEVDQLRRDIEDTQARNVELDRMLADTRRQRDQAEHELVQAKRALEESQARADFTQHTLTDAEHQVDTLRSERDKLKEAIDDSDLKAMELQDVLDKANAKLEAMHKAMGVPFTPFAVAPKSPPPAPEPVAEPHPVAGNSPSVPPVQAAGEPQSSEPWNRW